MCSEAPNPLRCSILLVLLIVYLTNRTDLEQSENANRLTNPWPGDTDKEHYETRIIFHRFLIKEPTIREIFWSKSAASIVAVFFFPGAPTTAGHETGRPSPYFPRSCRDELSKAAEAAASPISATRKEGLPGPTHRKRSVFTFTSEHRCRLTALLLLDGQLSRNSTHLQINIEEEVLTGVS